MMMRSSMLRLGAWRAGALLSLLLGPACTSGAVSPDPANTATKVTFTTSGGFAGTQEQLEVDPDGHLVLLVRGKETGRGQLAAADLQRLRALVASDAFRALAKSYMPADPCCDRFTYTVEVERAGGTQVVATMDDVAWPQPLAEAIALLKQARSKVSAPTQ